MNDEEKRKAGEPHILHVTPQLAVGGQLTIAKFGGMLHVAMDCRDWTRICDLLNDETANAFLSSRHAVTSVARLQELMLSDIGRYECLNAIQAFCRCATVPLAEAIDLSPLVLGTMLFVVDTERCCAMFHKRRYVLSGVEPLVKLQGPVARLREKQKEFQLLLDNSAVFDLTTCLATLKNLSHTDHSTACRMLEDGIKTGFDRVYITASQTTANDLQCHLQYLETLQLQITNVCQTMRSLDRVVMLDRAVLDRCAFYHKVAAAIDREDGYQPLLPCSDVSDVLSIYDKAIQLAEGLHYKTFNKSHNWSGDSREQQSLVKRIVDVVQMFQTSMHTPERARESGMSNGEDVSGYNIVFDTTVLTEELVTALEQGFSMFKGRKLVDYESSQQFSRSVSLGYDPPVSGCERVKEQGEAEATKKEVTSYRDHFRRLRQDYKTEHNLRVQLEQQLERQQSDYFKASQESQQLLEEALCSQDMLNNKVDKLEEEHRTDQELIRKQSERLACVVQDFKRYKETAQKNVTEMQNEVFRLQTEIRKLKQENSELQGAKTTVDADSFCLKERLSKQKASKAKPGLNCDGKRCHRLSREVSELIQNPASVEQLVRSEQALKTQVETKVKAFEKQELHLSAVKEQLDAMQHRLEEQARRTVEHQGAAETLGDPNRPSQLKVRFDDLYHNASVSLADALLPDTESSETRSRHSPERRINQFLCRLFMEVNIQVDKHFYDCQMAVIKSLSVDKIDVEKDRQLSASLKHCVRSLLAVSQARNKDEIEVVERVHSRLMQTDEDICATDVLDKVREFTLECTKFVWDVKAQPTPLTFTTTDRTYNPHRHRRTYAANSSSDMIHYHVWPTFVDESVNSVLSKGYVVT